MIGVLTQIDVKIKFQLFHGNVVTAESTDQAVNAH